MIKELKGVTAERKSLDQNKEIKNIAKPSDKNPQKMTLQELVDVRLEEIAGQEYVSRKTVARKIYELRG